MPCGASRRAGDSRRAAAAAEEQHRPRCRKASKEGRGVASFARGARVRPFRSLRALVSMAEGCDSRKGGGARFGVLVLALACGCWRSSSCLAFKVIVRQLQLPLLFRSFFDTSAAHQSLLLILSCQHADRAHHPDHARPRTLFHTPIARSAPTHARARASIHPSDDANENQSSKRPPARARAASRHGDQGVVQGELPQ